MPPDTLLGGSFLNPISRAKPARVCCPAMSTRLYISTPSDPGPGGPPECREIEAFQPLCGAFSCARRGNTRGDPGSGGRRIEVSGRPILLVDTAGLEPPDEGGAHRRHSGPGEVRRRRSRRHFVVVDGRAGLLPEDEAIARTCAEARGRSRCVSIKSTPPTNSTASANSIRLASNEPRAYLPSTTSTPSISWRGSLRRSQKWKQSRTRSRRSPRHKHRRFKLPLWVAPTWARAR